MKKIRMEVLINEGQVAGKGMVMKEQIQKRVERRKIKKEILDELSKKIWLKDEECRKDSDYLDCVYDILEHEKFQEMNLYIQHGKTTTLAHCIHVSYFSYKVCRKFSLDARSAARAGLLHDLFLYDWHTHSKETGKRFHGFTHPRTALNNATEYFKLSQKEKDIIVKHMWPMTIIPPTSMEGFVVSFVDKHCGLLETFGNIQGKKARKPLEAQ